MGFLMEIMGESGGQLLANGGLSNMETPMTSQPKQAEAQRLRTYSHDELWRIRTNMRKVGWYKTFSVETIKTIRKFRLNRRGKRGGWRIKPVHQDGVNWSNLIRPRSVSAFISRTDNIKIATANVQSVRGKHLQLKEYIISSNIDLCILTETWLQSTLIDDSWVACSALNNEGLRMLTSHRSNRRGGGIAIVFKPNFSVSILKEENLISFQYAIWRVQLKNKICIVIGLYRPPYSPSNPITLATFLDEFTNWIADVLAEYSGIVMVGDFNIHINNNEDQEATIFVETLEALDLQIQNYKSTHKCGNTLDLIISEDNDRVKVLETQNGPYVSDHCAVEGLLNINRNEVKHKSITFRKIKAINRDQFMSDLRFDVYPDNSIKDLANILEYELERVLHLRAPVQKMSISSWKRSPWFTPEVKRQKHLVRRKEKIWRKYQQDHKFVALRVETNKYCKLLKSAKLSVTSDLVKECKGIQRIYTNY